MLLGAAPEKVVAAAVRVRRRAASRHWLPLSNEYRRDTVNVLRNHALAQPVTIRPRQLIEYLAASVPLHCMDGWTNFAQAVACHVRSDTSGAVHLGYYAELRAAMALLASCGIGIFDKQHVVFDRSGRAHVITGSTQTPPGQQAQRLTTHVFAWEALEFWSSDNQSAMLLGSIISGSEISLTDWLEAFSPGNPARAVGQQWLTGWGLDLRRMVEDRESRNLLSYRPTGLEPPIQVPVDSTEMVLRTLWTVFQPSSAGGFETLDRFLIRRGVEAAYRLNSGQTPRQSRRRFRYAVEAAIHNLPLDSFGSRFWLDFLTRQEEPDDPRIMEWSFGNAKVGSGLHRIQVLSRSALLLRVASGAARQLLASAKFTAGDLEHWWRPLAENLGIIDSGQPLGPMTTLWEDVEGALQQLDDRLAFQAGATQPDMLRRSWMSEYGASLMTLSECERVGLWGMLP